MNQKPSQVPLLCFLVVLQTINPYITSGKSLFEKKEIFIDFSHVNEPYTQNMQTDVETKDDKHGEPSFVLK